MTAETVNHSPATRRLMAAVSDDMQRILAQTMERHAGVPNGESAIMEGTLFAFCAVAYGLRPEGKTADDVVALLTMQAAKYMTSFAADDVIGPAQGAA